MQKAELFRRLVCKLWGNVDSSISDMFKLFSDITISQIKIVKKYPKKLTIYENFEWDLNPRFENLNE